MHIRIVSGMIAAGLLIAVPAPARADDARCTYGDALALFQEFPVAVGVVRPRATGPALVQNISKCQYRVFADGQTFTFHEGDFITGGVAWLSDYAALGISRDEAIADIELHEDHVYLARVQPDGTIGPAVEQPLMRTAYKNAKHVVLGLIVFQHRAFILPLSAGEYVSTWVSFHPDTGPLSATVRIVVLPP